MQTGPFFRSLLMIGAVLSWFKSEQRDRRRKVKLARKHLASRARRFLTIYLASDEMRKVQFYRVVEQASKQCHPTQLAVLEDAQIAEATSNAAMKMVLANQEQSPSDQDAKTSMFVTDAYAIVAVAYHRAAGLYLDDKEMQELGTAAVHLLTIATSYMRNQKNPPTT